MSEAASEQLDLSRLPPFRLVDVDYEAIVASRLASLQARFAAAGIDYDVGMLETDPAVILQQEDAFRQTLDLQALNDAGKRLTVAYGYGPALDHIAATYFADIGVRRMAAVDDPRPFAEQPDDWEDDDRFRRRISLAPEARSPYTPGAYVYAALTTSPLIADAVALNWSTGLVDRGDVCVVILGKAGADEAALAEMVGEALRSRPIVALTDNVFVATAPRVDAEISVKLLVRRGPDPAVVREEAIRQINIYRASRYRIGAPLALSGIDSAAHVGGVEIVQRSAPMADISTAPNKVINVTGVTVTTEAIYA